MNTRSTALPTAIFNILRYIRLIICKFYVLVNWHVVITLKIRAFFTLVIVSFKIILNLYFRLERRPSMIIILQALYSWVFFNFLFVKRWLLRFDWLRSKFDRSHWVSDIEQLFLLWDRRIQSASTTMLRIVSCETNGFKFYHLFVANTLFEAYWTTLLLKVIFFINLFWYEEVSHTGALGF